MDVFFEIQIDNEQNGRIIIELNDKELPKTCHNFREICKGGNPGDGGLSFKNSIFHRIEKGFMAQGGDITRHNGYGGQSVYGKMFPDEGFSCHTSKGDVGMASYGKDTNSSQFYITFMPCPWLDGETVVFGRVKESHLSILRDINEQGSLDGKPKGIVKIVDCGVVEPEPKEAGEI